MRRPSYDRVPTTESEHEHPRDNTNSSSHFSEDEIKIKTKYDWILEKIHACKRKNNKTLLVISIPFMV